MFCIEPERTGTGKLTLSPLVPVQAVLSVLYFGYFFLSSFCAAIFIALIRLLTSGLDCRGVIAHTLTRWLAHHYISLNPLWKVEYTNTNYLRWEHNYIFVANHQSLTDVLVLSKLNAFYKWIAKAQTWRLVGVGQLMRINDYLPVAHGDVRSVRRMMRRCRLWLREGMSIFIFPEGERSIDGRLLEFKDGPFRLAAQTNTPIMPIVIDGTRHILQRGQWLINFRGSVIVKLLPPVYPQDYDNDPDRLNAAVRRMIEQELQGTGVIPVEQTKSVA